MKNGDHYPVDEKALPVKLPPLENYQPVESDEPQPMLAKAAEWVNTTAGEAGVSPDAVAAQMRGDARDEHDAQLGGLVLVLPALADPRNEHAISYQKADSGRQGKLNAHGNIPGRRSLHRRRGTCRVAPALCPFLAQNVLRSAAKSRRAEPFRKLFHQGLITSFAYQDSTGRTVPVDEVSAREGKHYLISTGEEVRQITAKMSKTLKNVVNPDDVITEYGADTFRLYEMYMGPLDASKPWNPRDISGLFRFLQRTGD